MRVFSRGDMDGLTSLVFLSMAEDVSEIAFAHPKDMQDGKVPVTTNDIITNLPYVPGCGMWFDHHVSEDRKLEGIGSYKGKFAVASSCASIIYKYYHRPEFEKFKDLLAATDRLDAANLTKEDVENSSGWILLGLTLDPRTGLGPEFRKYFRWLVEYVKELPLEKILEHREVKKRCDRLLNEHKQFKDLLEKHSRQDGNVIITDFRGVKNLPAGNRFIVFTLYPEANVEVRIFGGKAGNTVIAVGHSIFNRTCQVNVGELLAGYGGGGHRGAGTCQIENEKAEATIAEIIAQLKKQ
ncbi:MAG: exopolyphosphatase [Planctomycetes bacterium]|nr:exopolyphosphatase [Planctomycetota bacterium]